ncbi:hypothetical protein PVK06_046963 [Gossypium arboreum]|uniref:RNase H type-1 domain-containing protein n=1 Tax=Gossypium arboreum TaxID=29729 RepID=A0ABR0MCJ4_GOSAR|nr:hypothetical protein PVK06_046963 [Gossypium arboreum]
MERVQGGISHSSACEVCGHIIEDVLHVIRDCLATNSLEVVSAIQEGFKIGSNSTLIRRTLQRLSEFHHWSICHIPREENQKADRLVKLAHLDGQGLQVFEVFPFKEMGYMM